MPGYSTSAMNASGTTKLSADTLKFLPAKLRKRWRGTDVYFTVSNDTIVVKKLREPKQTYEQALAEFQKLGKVVTRADLRKALAWARRKS